MAASVGRRQGGRGGGHRGWGRQVLPKCVTKAPRCVTAKWRPMRYVTLPLSPFLLLLLHLYIVSYIVRSTSCCPCQLTAPDVCRRQLRSCRYTYGWIRIQIQIQTPTQMQIHLQIQGKGQGASERMPVFAILTFRINKYLCIYLLYVGAPSLYWPLCSYFLAGKLDNPGGEKHMEIVMPECVCLRSIYDPELCDIGKENKWNEKHSEFACFLQYP